MPIRWEAQGDNMVLRDGATAIADASASGFRVKVPFRADNTVQTGSIAVARMASGVSAVTGTLTVATGLATVTAVVATAQSDPDGVALAMVSATIGDQSATPVAGSVILKAWKVTATGNATLIAATAAQNVNWIAFGT